MREISGDSDGFTLMEILVTITLITVLMALVIPCWGVIARSRARQAATGIVMDSLEHARNVAITGKNNVWVIFQHQEGIHQDSLRTLVKQGAGISPLGSWQVLPTGTSFHTDALMEERPPAEILTIALNGKSPQSGETFGAVMFQSSGRIGIPLPGSHPLSLQLDSQSGISPEPITLSRATGRATCK